MCEDRPDSHGRCAWTQPGTLRSMRSVHGHGHGNGHGVFVLATHPKGSPAQLFIRKHCILSCGFFFEAAYPPSSTFSGHESFRFLDTLSCAREQEGIVTLHPFLLSHTLTST